MAVWLRRARHVGRAGRHARSLTVNVSSFEHGVGLPRSQLGVLGRTSPGSGVRCSTRTSSIVYGRVFPPRDAADPERIPGFLAAIGPGGPIGYATNVTIDEANASDASRPQGITVRAQSPSVDLTLTFSVEDLVVNRMQAGPLASGMDFLQLRGRYAVAGTAGDRRIAFQAPGSAETFRGR